MNTGIETKALAGIQPSPGARQYDGTRGPFQWDCMHRLCGVHGQEVCTLPDYPRYGPDPSSAEGMDTQRLLRGSFELLEFVRHCSASSDVRLAAEATRVLKACHLWD